MTLSSTSTGPAPSASENTRNAAEPSTDCQASSGARVSTIKRSRARPRENPCEDYLYVFKSGRTAAGAPGARAPAAVRRGRRRAGLHIGHAVSLWLVRCPGTAGQSDRGVRGQRGEQGRDDEVGGP